MLSVSAPFYAGKQVNELSTPKRNLSLQNITNTKKFWNLVTVTSGFR